MEAVYLSYTRKCTCFYSYWRQHMLVWFSTGNYVDLKWSWFNWWATSIVSSLSVLRCLGCAVSLWQNSCVMCYRNSITFTTRIKLMKELSAIFSHFFLLLSRHYIQHMTETSDFHLCRYSQVWDVVQCKVIVEGWKVISILFSSKFYF